MTDEETNETSLLLMSLGVQMDGYAAWLMLKIWKGDDMEDLTPALEAAEAVMFRIQHDGGVNKDAIAHEIARCLVRLPDQPDYRRPIDADHWRMSISLYREFLIFLRERKRSILAGKAT